MIIALFVDSKCDCRGGFIVVGDNCQSIATNCAHEADTMSIDNEETSQAHSEIVW